MNYLKHSNNSYKQYIIHLLKNINLTIGLLRHIHKNDDYDSLNNTFEIKNNYASKKKEKNKIREFKIFPVMKFRSLSPIICFSSKVASPPKGILLSLSKLSL